MYLLTLASSRCVLLGLSRHAGCTVPRWCPGTQRRLHGLPLLGVLALTSLRGARTASALSSAESHQGETLSPLLSLSPSKAQNVVCSLSLSHMYIARSSTAF